MHKLNVSLRINQLPPEINGIQIEVIYLPGRSDHRMISRSSQDQVHGGGDIE